MSMDSPTRFLSVFLLIVLLATGGAPSVMAQDDLVMPNASQPQPAEPKEAPNLSLPPDDGEVTILRDNFAGKYNLSTLENLSKLYWRLGAFDFDDDMAVGNYLKINDCKIFTEYLNDDLEWAEIVKVMKGHLKKESSTFPLNYQFLLELHLGRYDPEQKGFPLVDRTGFTDAKRIEVDSIDFNKEVCYDPGTIKDYPKSVIILLPRPFTLDLLKVDEHVAQAYILRKKSEYSKLSDEQKVRAYERDAYLRLRVTFSQYHGNFRGEGNQTMAILFGTIDGYEIFEDSGQKRLMLSVDLKEQEKKAALEPEMMSKPLDKNDAPAPAAPVQTAAPAPATAPATAPTPAMGLVPQTGSGAATVPAVPATP